MEKCVIVPLWRFEQDAVRHFLSVHVPGWTDFAIKLCAECLGFLIGPDAGGREWDSVLDKVSESARYMKSLGLPKLHCFSLF